MDYQELEEKLKELKIEDFIWIIYIGIIILSLYSNKLEKEYFINNNNDSKEKYRMINTIIFTILIFVYYYFYTSSINSLNSIKPGDSNKKKKLTYLSYIASTLVLVSGIIFLYIVLDDNNLDVEIAFN